MCQMYRRILRSNLCPAHANVSHQDSFSSMYFSAWRDGTRLDFTGIWVQTIYQSKKTLNGICRWFRSVFTLFAHDSSHNRKNPVTAFRLFTGLSLFLHRDSTHQCLSFARLYSDLLIEQTVVFVFLSQSYSSRSSIPIFSATFLDGIFVHF